MGYAALTWIIITAIFAILAHIAIWARTENHKARWLSLIGFFIGSIIAVIAVLFSMGWAVPCKPYILDPGKGVGRYKILGAYPVPEETIYLFVEIQGKGPKVCYVPWKSGKDTQNLMESIEFGFGEMGVGGGEGNGFFGEARFYEQPHQGNGPPKEERRPEFSLDNLMNP